MPTSRESFAQTPIWHYEHYKSYHKGQKTGSNAIISCTCVCVCVCLNQKWWKQHTGTQRKKKTSMLTEKFKNFKNPQVKLNVKTGMLVWALHWHLTSKLTGHGQSTANHWQPCEEVQGSAVAHAFIGGVSYLLWTMVCGHENNPGTIKNAVQTNANHSPPVKDSRIERNSRTRDPKNHEISQRTEGRWETS